MSAPLLTAAQVAQQLGIGVSTAYRLMGDGTLPAVRIPGCRAPRVRPEVLELCLERWARMPRRGRGGRSEGTR